jgi:hypothetical protein
MEVDTRRRKIADIFRGIQPDRPVVIIAPELLDDEGLRAYYRALLETPIKGAVKKASKQLAKTAESLGDRRSRVLIAINRGYEAASHPEFKQMLVNRCRNDASNIDWVVVAGVYHLSDGMESSVLYPFELERIRSGPKFDSYSVLKAEWDLMVEGLMTSVMIGDESRIFDKTPIQDIKFDLDGITYVKPRPWYGRSPFEILRQRVNTSGIDVCLPVATAFPRLDERTWGITSDAAKEPKFFKSSFEEWKAFLLEEENLNDSPLEPFCPVDIPIDEYGTWALENHLAISSHSICEFAAVRFDYLAKELIRAAVPASEIQVSPIGYIYLITQEIGGDMADDITSIILVQELESGTECRDIIEVKRMFFEHGLVLASAYAVKWHLPLIYVRDQSFGWK